MNGIGRHKVPLQTCEPHHDPAAVQEFRCMDCSKLLHVRKGRLTNGQRWLFTRQGQRHYKTRCNFMNKE